jgi:hypothetical protein
MNAMGKTMLKALFTAITLFGLQPANAVPFEELNLPLGSHTHLCPACYGVVGCDLLLGMYEANQAASEVAFFSWWQGYISGWNEALYASGKPMIDTLLMGESEQAGFLKGFCLQHPDLSTMEAANRLRLELEARTAKRDRDKGTTFKDRFPANEPAQR